MKMRLLAVPGCFAALAIMAAPVQADTGGEANFLAGLNSAGISYNSGPDAVGIGRRACELMDQGSPQADIVKAMIDQNPGFTTDGATKFVRVAEDKLCPQHTGGALAPAASAGPAPQPTTRVPQGPRVAELPELAAVGDEPSRSRGSSMRSGKSTPAR